MARPEQRLAANVDGPFYVDRSCIDCGTCWQFDPLHYAPTGSSSQVQRQPQGDGELPAGAAGAAGLSGGRDRHQR